MSPAAAWGPPIATPVRLISICLVLKIPASAPSQAVLCHIASRPVATRTGRWVSADEDRPTMAGTVAAPINSCKNLRRNRDMEPPALSWNAARAEFILRRRAFACQQMQQGAADRGLPRRRRDLRAEQIGHVEHVTGALAEGRDMGGGNVEVE